MIDLFKAYRRGISMMEVALGTMLVGGVLAATIGLIGPTVRSTTLAGERQLAAMLADDLLDEIAVRSFGEPDGDSGAIGLDAGEAALKRADFDDVDDYNGYFARPTDLNGDPISGFDASWGYAVTVNHVEIGNPASTSGSLTGVKRITVYVVRGGRPLAERSVLRTRDFDTQRRQ